MSKESATTSSSVWEVIDRIFFRASIAISVVFPIAYGFLWFLNPHDHSLLAAACDFFLALITNVFPFSLGYVLSHIFLLRRLLAIRSEQESNALTIRIASQTQTTVAGQLETMQQTIKQTLDKFLTLSGLGNATYDLGVAGIGGDWKELAEFKEKGELGKKLKERITHDQNAT